MTTILKPDSNACRRNGRGRRTPLPSPRTRHPHSQEHSPGASPLFRAFAFELSSFPSLESSLSLCLARKCSLLREYTLWSRAVEETSVAN